MKKVIRLTESDLVNIVKKVLKEQLIGTLASRPAFNLSKSGPAEISSTKTPQVQDDITNIIDDCYMENIYNLVNKCKNNKSLYQPDKDAYYIAKQLYEAMDGFSIGVNTMNTLKYIDDAAKFCRVSNAYNYDGKNLATWIEEEVSLQPDLVWNVLKKHANKLNLGDKCWTGA
jgi:hypothetical protein